VATELEEVVHTAIESHLETTTIYRRTGPQEKRQASSKVYVRLDVKDFFDTIDREILLHQLSSIVPDNDILSLVRLCISMGRVAPSLKWEECEVGIPQGAILSPLLSNLYLVTFDKFMESISCAYIRYSDDCVAWFSDTDSAHTASRRRKMVKALERLVDKGKDQIAVYRICVECFTKITYFPERKESVQKISVLD